ncbi:MAG TPA: tetratricopeptide repeat protein [Verrucomicrobiae bacterium]|nr:tetratricopeptide repeat protein [Verrucomicrobiae bacterium]
MKRFTAFVLLCFAFALPQARAQQNPDDQYVIIYSLMQQADALQNSGALRQALNGYAETQSELQKFQKVYPDWHTNIVSYRLNYLAQKISEVSAQLPPATNQPAQTVATSNAVPATAADLQSQLNALHDQVRQLQTDNTTLQSKLKEALSVQPATVDAGELAKAQEQIQSLMKQNDLLKAGLTQAQNNAAIGVGAAATVELRRQLDSSNQKLAEQTKRADKLAAENQKLQAQIENLQLSAKDTATLREENQLLKKQLAELRSTGAAGSQLAQMQAQITKLQSDANINWLERLALENRLQQLQSGTANSVPSAEIQRELETLRARLAADEAHVVPYTPEELALFKQSEPQLITADKNHNSDEMPADTAILVAQAQRDFSSHQFDKAEDIYTQILRRDENNGAALANLATIDIELGKLDEAEKYIHQALAQSPDDVYDLTVLGRLQYLKKDYDGALNTLSRAASLDPQNAQIQNYLGVTYADKGLRAQAETALRKALQIDPNYGEAHNNLAVIYITAQPPLVELARWHYQKALDDGHPHNPELEKMLTEKGASVNPQ